MDIDLDSSKANLIKQLQNENPNITIITSNPCVESWFLFHFVKHPQTQNSSQSNKNYLKTFISNYSEKMDVYAKVEKIKNNLKEMKEKSLDCIKDMFMDTVIEQMSDTIVEKSGENITQQLYEQMKEYLLTKQNVFSYLDAKDGVLAYYDSSAQCTIGVWIP